MAKVKINLVPAMNKVGAFIKEKAIANCPVDRGDLRRSIDYRIEGNKIILFATDEKASDMEYGVPPEPLSDEEKQDLTGWAERHGAKPKKIIKYIQKHGIKVGTPEQPLHITSYGRDSTRPYLRPAVYQNLPEIVAMLKENVEVK